MNFDYAGFERCLKACSEAAVKLLVERYNSRSPFYAICVYVDGFGGTFGLYANTLADFDRTLEDYRKRWPDPYSCEAEVLDLKYSCGDWEYQTLHMLDDLKATFASLESWSRHVYDLSNKSALTDEDLERFDEIGCRVAMAIESDPTLNSLRRTDDFLVMVCVAQEATKASLNRLPWFKEFGNLEGFDPSAYVPHA